MTLFTDPDSKLTTYQYDIASRLTTEIYDSGIQKRTTYDAASQIVSIIEETTGGTLKERFTFAYDEVGNRTKVQDNAGALTTYAYDSKDRLTQDATTGVNTHTYDYTYDGNDNRLTASENGLTTYVYDAANRMVTSMDNTGALSTYSYDANGNLTLIVAGSALARTTMAYDKENRLSVHQTKSAGELLTKVATYMYDGDGLKRVETVKDTAAVASVTTLIWDGDEYLQERS